MFRTVSRWVVFAALVFAAAPIAMHSTPARAETEASSDDAEKKLDRVILTSGREVMGEIIEETSKRIVMMVHFRGMPPVKTTYQKSSIIDIQHGVGLAVSEEARQVGLIVGDDKSAKVEKIDPDAARIYLIEFEGTLGSDISVTPLKKLFEDVDELFDDLVPQIRSGKKVMVVDPAMRDKHLVVIEMDCETDPRQGFDGLFTAEKVEPIISEQIQKGRRVIFWVKRAVDGAMFLPWISPEVYYYPNGVMYFSDDLGDFDMGDDMVDEKQISLRLGHAEGLAIKGGYDHLADPIIKTMALSRYWLSYQLVGGKPEFMTREPTEDDIKAGWILLSDNGGGDNEDSNPMRVSNDRLVLDAEIAQKLGLAQDDSVDSEEDLAFALRVHRNYVIESGDGERIFEKWRDAKEAAWDRINPNSGSLWSEFNRIAVDGEYTDRKRSRGRQVRTLEKIYSDYSRFAEVWDPNGQGRSRLDVMIATIKKRQQADKAAQRG